MHAATISQLLLGLWLLGSAFLWPHSPGQLLLAVVGGTLAALYAACALARRCVAGRLNLLAWWLIVGALILPAWNPASVANHVIVGFGLLAFLHASKPTQLPH